jgi:hypothetical protein
LTLYLTISIRKDELEVIDKLINESKNHKTQFTRHQIIKLAIRHFLFPREKEHLLDGKRAIIEKVMVQCDGPPSRFKDADLPEYEDRKIRIIPDSERKIHIISEEEAARRKAAAAEKKRQIEEAMKKDGFL